MCLSTHDHALFDKEESEEDEADMTVSYWTHSHAWLLTGQIEWRPQSHVLSSTQLCVHVLLILESKFLGFMEQY